MIPSDWRLAAVLVLLAIVVRVTAESLRERNDRDRDWQLDRIADRGRYVADDGKRFLSDKRFGRVQRDEIRDRSDTDTLRLIGRQRRQDSADISIGAFQRAEVERRIRIGSLTDRRERQVQNLHYRDLVVRQGDRRLQRTDDQLVRTNSRRNERNEYVRLNDRNVNLTSRKRSIETNLNANVRKVRAGTGKANAERNELRSMDEKRKSDEENSRLVVADERSLKRFEHRRGVSETEQRQNRADRQDDPSAGSQRTEVQSGADERTIRLADAMDERLEDPRVRNVRERHQIHADRSIRTVRSDGKRLFDRHIDEENRAASTESRSAEYRRTSRVEIAANDRDQREVVTENRRNDHRSADISIEQIRAERNNRLHNIRRVILTADRFQERDRTLQRHQQRYDRQKRSTNEHNRSIDEQREDEDRRAVRNVRQVSDGDGELNDRVRADRNTRAVRQNSRRFDRGDEKVQRSVERDASVSERNAGRATDRKESMDKLENRRASDSGLSRQLNGRHQIRIDMNTQPIDLNRFDDRRAIDNRWATTGTIERRDAKHPVEQNSKNVPNRRIQSLRLNDDRRDVSRPYAEHARHRVEKEVQTDHGLTTNSERNEPTRQRTQQFDSAESRYTVTVPRLEKSHVILADFMGNGDVMNRLVNAKWSWQFVQALLLAAIMSQFLKHCDGLDKHRSGKTIFARLTAVPCK